MQCDTISAFGRCTNYAMWRVGDNSLTGGMEPTNVCGHHLDQAIEDRLDSASTATVKRI